VTPACEAPEWCGKVYTDDSVPPGEHWHIGPAAFCSMECAYASPAIVGTWQFFGRLLKPGPGLDQQARMEHVLSKWDKTLEILGRNNGGES